MITPLSWRAVFCCASIWCAVDSALAVTGDTAGGTIQDKGGSREAVGGPRLPDWSTPEQHFWTNTPVRSAEMKTRLADLRAAWDKAGEATDDALQSRDEPPSGEAVQTLWQLADSFNALAEEFDTAFFGHHAAPLPRLRMPTVQQLVEHARHWPEAKRLEHETDLLDRDIQRLKAEADAVNRDKAARESGEATETGSQVFDDRHSSRHELKHIQRIVQRQLVELEHLLVDASRIAPPATSFTDDASTAFYKSTPRIEIRKTNGDGQSLSESQQAPDYPKPFLGGSVVGGNEGPFVDPSLRVQLVCKTADKRPRVRAGVYGRVTAVEESAGTVEIAVDEEQTRVIFLGFQPQNIRIGDRVQPSVVIGHFDSAPRGRRIFEFLVHAVDANDRLISPGAALHYARRQPTTADSLDRDGPELSITPLPVKQQAHGEGNGAGRLMLAYDDSVQRPDFERMALAARERVAKCGFEVAKARVNVKLGEISLLKSHQRQVERDMKTAASRIATIEAQGDGVLADAEKLVERKKDLEAELVAVKQSKSRMDVIAKRAKTSSSDSDLEALRSEARNHHARLQRLDSANVDWEDDKARLAAKISGLTNERSSVQRKLMQLPDLLRQLAARIASANAELEQARADLEVKEQAVSLITLEKTQVPDVAIGRAEPTIGSETSGQDLGKDGLEAPYADALSTAERIVSALEPIALAGLTIDFPLTKAATDLMGTTWIVESGDGQKDRWKFGARTVDYQNLSVEADRGSGSWSVIGDRVTIRTGYASWEGKLSGNKMQGSAANPTQTSKWNWTAERQ